MRLATRSLTQGSHGEAADRLKRMHVVESVGL